MSSSFFYSQPFYKGIVVVSGHTDYVFYKKLFEEIRKNENLNCELYYCQSNYEGINFLNKSIITFGETLANNVGDRFVIDSCLKHKHNKPIFGIIDFDDGYNYFCEDLYKYKKDMIDGKIAYSDGSDLESMLLFYNWDYLSNELASSMNISKGKASDMLNNAIKQSSKLKEYRYLQLIIREFFDCNSNVYRIPGNNFELTNQDYHGFFSAHTSISGKKYHLNYANCLDENENVNFDCWFLECLANEKVGCDKQFATFEDKKEYFKDFYAYSKENLSNIEEDIFREVLDKPTLDSYYFDPNSKKIQSYRYRGHDIPVILNYHNGVEVKIDISKKVQKMDSSSFGELPSEIKRTNLIDPMDFLIYFSKPGALLYNKQFCNSELYKKIIRFMSTFHD